MEITDENTPEALIVGAGPAGLMAADELSRAGYAVVIAEAMPSAARKFLMAGKSGLNLTKDEPLETFLKAYHPRPPVLEDALRQFGPEDVKNWARDLGQQVFTGSSGRVFPNAMKASPLLRAWLRRLDVQGVQLRLRWRWTGMDQGQRFDTPDGPRVLNPKVTILAMGGASWSRLGAGGAWISKLAEEGVNCAPFKPANMGFSVDWSPHMTRHFGQPVKNVILSAGDTKVRGEFVISQRGLEGSAIYAVSRAIREGADLRIDLKPDWSTEQVAGALAKPRGKSSVSNHLRKTLRFDPAKVAFLREFSSGPPEATAIKDLLIRHTGPRPMDEAISTAGGVSFKAVDDGLMMRNRFGVFCAGEMLDWEAPTGGYLLTGCLATGRLAGRAAIRYLSGAASAHADA